MKTLPTEVMFIWHMHQPCYKAVGKNYYLLPWVRLHAVKDYYGMAAILEQFQKVKVTFNFSGILLEQILDYSKNKAKDYYLELTLKKAEKLTKKEKAFIIDRFFSVNFERYILHTSRYLSLHKKREENKTFTKKDIVDLQVLFNLSWFHPITVKKDKKISALIKQGKDYTQKDKEYIIKKQYEIISSIIPLYKKLLKAKRIEISLTPHQHPIMPLVYDMDIVKKYHLGKAPSTHFSHPEDCLWHLKKAKKVFKDIFQTDIKGSWPSEGGVSEDILDLYHKEKFKWIGADEEILFKSLTTDFVSLEMIKSQRHLLYYPHEYKGVNIFFRDRGLADAISFIYQGWEDPVFAANDFLEQCKTIHYRTKDMVHRRVIPIIMDGENAWEFYRNGGWEFLSTIYGALEHSQILSTTTPSEYRDNLKKDKGKNNHIKPLEKIHPGSWINADFHVWIGSKENNHNWVVLKKLRDVIEKYAKTEKIRKKAMEYFYIIEGSDWNWWNTFYDPTGDFQKIFIAYVKEIYSILGKKAPANVLEI